MKTHSSKFTGIGSKNKNIAHNFGIAFAQRWFKDMQNVSYQGFMFDWNEPLGDIVTTTLRMHYPKDPKNIEELNKIADSAANIEYSNLKEAYEGELPVKQHSEEDIISNVTDMSTGSFLFLTQTKFYWELFDKKVEDLDNVWKQKYLDENSIESLKQKAVNRIDEILVKKHCSSNLAKAQIVKNVINFYDNIDNLEDTLYQGK